MITVELTPLDQERRYLAALREELDQLRLRDPASRDIRYLERDLEVQVRVVSRMEGVAVAEEHAAGCVEG